jgi:hypothetical protein
MSSKKPALFGNTKFLNQTREKFENERKEKLGIETLNKNSEEIIPQDLNSSVSKDNVEKTAPREKKKELVNGKNKKRFIHSKSDFIPTKYLKSDLVGTVNIPDEILNEYKYFSLKCKMGVKDLISLAAYKFLLDNKQVKEELIKKFEL